MYPGTDDVISSQTDQINLSLYRTKAEVLANFDIDSACIGYDGTQVFCLPRCRDAMVTRMNTINGGLNKISYIRLDKYRSRGFRFGVPEFVQVPMGKKMVGRTYYIFDLFLGQDQSDPSRILHENEIIDRFWNCF